MSTGNLPFTDDSAEDVSWPFSEIRWQDGNGSFCGIRDLHMHVGERQVLVAFLPFTDKYPSNSLG